MARRQRAFGRRARKADYGVAIDVYAAEDRCCWPIKALVDQNTDCCIEVDSYAARDSINKLQEEVTVVDG
jgi:hypothetical protein